MDSSRRAVAADTSHRAAQPSEKTEGNGVPDVAIRQRATAEYISEMILELRNFARSNQLYTVMVPLEYAYYEAFSIANRVEVPPGEIERIRQLSRASEDLEQVPPAS